MDRFVSNLYGRRALSALFVVLFSLFVVPRAAVAQSWMAQAQANGFTLKKVVSDTMINTGQTFSYTIYFSIPAGATNVTISDVLPSTLEFLSASFTSPCGAPTVVSPAVNTMGGTYSLSWASVPGGCSGSFTITVRFPNGTTCPGTTARNRVCETAMLNGTPIDLCTPFVSTSALATDPWEVNKWVIGAAYQGGACPYATGDSVITYQVCVYKNVGTTGQMNLVNGVVTDVLPVGAVLQSSTCGATQSGQTITWNVGNLSALPMYNSSCCTFTVLYPRALFPNGSQIQNQAVLNGTLGTAQPGCGPSVDSSQVTCVEIKSIVSAQISKWAYTNGQPGCSGKYLVYICNNGNTPLASFTVTDTVPAALTGLSVGTISGGMTVTNLGNIFTATSTGPLAPGQCVYFEINFTIPASATVGSTITNCAWFSAPGVSPIQACNTFTVAAPAPTACVWKEVCAKQPSYTPGSVFRYRLRVQNIGGTALTGTTITDVLNPNLTYVGNPSYYTGTSWSAPCQTTSNWTGVALTYTPGTNTVTATLPSIPAVCQNIFYSSCGMYGTGGVPYYFIEFDVKVVDTSALGNIPNKFTISGGTLPSPVTSNIDYVTVVGTAGFSLQKGVKKASASSYSTSTTSPAGGTISYALRLTVAPGSVALRHITFADLLPRDNGTNDQLILGPCTPRGSVFDVAWSSAISSSPTAAPYNNGSSFARVDNFAPAGAPGVMFVGGCGTAGTWVGGISAGAKNLGYYFGASPVAATFTATSQFNAAVPGTAGSNQVSCNTFAANGAVRHLIASSIISDQPIGQLESLPACVTIKKDICLDSIKLDLVCAGKDAAGNQQYTVNMSGWNPNTSGVLLLSASGGTFSPSTFAVPPGSFSLSSTFTDTPPISSMITIYFTFMVNGEVICRDSIIRDLPQCPTEPPIDCCSEFKRQIDHTKLTYTNTGQVNLTATVTAGPSLISRFVASLVSVQRRQVCNNVPQPWQRVFGDITAGSLGSTLAPGPQFLQIYSRVAQWGPGACVDFSSPVALNLTMLFPPPPTSFKCKDTLIFAIRYSFTDCKCVTCERVVYDTLVRTYTWLPWDKDPTRSDIKFGGVAKRTEDVQADTPAVTSLLMSTNDNGTLWVINPSDAGNDVTVLGAEIISNVVPLANLTSGSSQGVINGASGFIAFDAPPGSNTGVDITFANVDNKKQFPVDVRYLFRQGADGEQQFSDVVNYVARVPGVDADKMAGDDTKPSGVRTFAMSFTNSNGFEEHVHRIYIRSTGAARILAVGPAGTDATQAMLSPISNVDGSFMVSALETGDNGVAPTSVVRPIYITLSDVDGPATFSFTSFDILGEPLSEGTFELTDPISSVSGDERGDGGDRQSVKLSVHPNPATETSTMSLGLSRSMSRVQLMVTDLQGTTVMTLLDQAMDDGNHVVHANISSLPSGTYFVVVRTAYGTSTQPLTVTR